MNKQGYTLIEVSLFLAISGILTLVAIAGIGPRLTNVRFSTGMRATRDNIEKQLSASKLGNNSKTTSLKCSQVGDAMNISVANDDSSCVFIGKIAVLNATDNTVVYRSIVGLTEPTLACPVSDDSSMEFIKKCSIATILDDSISGPETYDLPNGIAQAPNSTRAIGYVRSPVTNTARRFTFTSSRSTDPYSGIALSDPSLTYNVVDGVPSVNIPVCYSLGKRMAKLLFSVEADELKLIFNEAC